MNFNLLVGSIPATIYQLKNLVELDMNDNLLQGSLSSDIGNLSSLRFVASHKQGRLEASRATAGGITLDVKLGRRDEAVTRQRSNEAILCVS